MVILFQKPVLKRQKCTFIKYPPTHTTQVSSFKYIFMSFFKSDAKINLYEKKIQIDKEVSKVPI